MSTYLACVSCSNINLTAQEKNLEFYCKASRWCLLFDFLTCCSGFVSVAVINYLDSKQGFACGGVWKRYFNKQFQALVHHCGDTEETGT